MSDDGMVTFDSPEDLSSGGDNLVNAEGTFHCNGISFHINEKPTGKSYDGWTLLAKVVAGTDPSQIGKQLTIYMKKPTADKPYFQKLRAAVLMACGFMKIEDFGKSISFNPKEPGVFQFVAKVKADEPEEGKKPFYSLEFLNIYHVDDPEVKDIPKCAESLSFIDPSRRYADPAIFERLKEIKKGSSQKKDGPDEGATPADLGI